MAIDIKPHAYDPARQPELFDGVLAIGSAVIVLWGGRGYYRAAARMRKLTEALKPRMT